MGRRAGATPSSRGVILQYCPPCEGLVVRFSYMKNQDDLMHKVSGIHQAHNEVRIEQVGSNLPIINLNSQWLPRVYQPRGDCFKNAGSPCRMIFCVILILILAGFCFLRLGTDRPKCLKINFLCGFSCDFAKYTF